jgi:uncharacterized protein YjbI with pentapeptide repeats
MSESFFLESDIKKFYLDKDNLEKVEFYKVDLTDVDLSSSNISGILFDMKSVNGVVIDRFQSHEIAKLLGVKFKE